MGNIGERQLPGTWSRWTERWASGWGCGWTRKMEKSSFSKCSLDWFRNGMRLILTARWDMQPWVVWKSVGEYTGSIHFFRRENLQVVKESCWETGVSYWFYYDSCHQIQAHYAFHHFPCRSGLEMSFLKSTAKVVTHGHWWILCRNGRQINGVAIPV